MKALVLNFKTFRFKVQFLLWIVSESTLHCQDSFLLPINFTLIPVLLNIIRVNGLFIRPVLAKPFLYDINLFIDRSHLHPNQMISPFL